MNVAVHADVAHWRSVRVLEVVRLEHLLMEGIHLDGRSSVESTFGSWKRQWRSNVDAHARRMEVACLAVVKRVGAARRGCVIAWRLICKRGECERIGVKERGCKSPWLNRSPWRRIPVMIFELVVISKMPIACMVSYLMRVGSLELLPPRCAVCLRRVLAPKANIHDN